MTKLLAAVVQSGTSNKGTRATLEKAEALIAECGLRGANVAVFPEAFIGGYPKGADFHIYVGARTPEGRDDFAAYYRESISVPGPETERLGVAARNANLFLIMSVIERDAGTLYCSVLYFGPDGELLGKHRKLMPTALERLCWGFGDGSTLPIIESPWGNIGAVICWENYMPLLRTAMYAQHVAIYCMPTADDRDSWVSTARHIAMEGRCFVLSACQYLQRKDFPESMNNKMSNNGDEVIMRGGSVIVDPLGNVLAGPNYEGENILVAELDMDQIIRGKIDFDVVGHYARNDIFKLTIDRRARPAAEFISTG
jgi:nitrilase